MYIKLLIASVIAFQAGASKPAPRNPQKPIQKSDTKLTPSAALKPAPKLAEVPGPVTAPSGKDLIPVLYEVEAAYGKNSLRAEENYLNKPLTFHTFVSQVVPKGSSIVLKASIVYQNGQGPMILQDIVVKPTMRTVVKDLEPDDIVEITGTLTGRGVKSKDEVVISGGIAGVYGSGGSVSGGGGAINGGTVTRSWAEYVFTGATVSIVSRKADRDREAARIAAEQRKSEEEARAAKQEIYRKAIKEFDLASLKKVVEWEGTGHHTITALAKVSIDADPSQKEYNKVLDAFRFLASQCAKDFGFGDRTSIYSIARPAVEARRSGLLKVLLDCETFNPKNTLDSMPVFDAMTTYRRSSQRKEDDSISSLPKVALDALDVEMYKLVYEHPRCQGLADYTRSFGPGFRGSLWSEFGWVDNDYLRQLRQIIPRMQN